MKAQCNFLDQNPVLAKILYEEIRLRSERSTNKEKLVNVSTSDKEMGNKRGNIQYQCHIWIRWFYRIRRHKWETRRRHRCSLLPCLIPIFSLCSQLGFFFVLLIKQKSEQGVKWKIWFLALVSENTKCIMAWTPYLARNNSNSV